MYDYLWFGIQQLVPLGGAAFLWATRRRSRRAAALGIAALIWMAVLFGYHFYFNTSVWPMLSRRGFTGTFLRAHELVTLAGRAFGLALLVYAVMADRRAPPAADD